MSTEYDKAAYTAQRMKETVLDALARLLPFVPRDLTVAVTAVPSKDSPGRFTTSISVVPVTDMGKAIYPVLQKELQKELAKSLVATGASNGTKETQTEG